VPNRRAKVHCRLAESRNKVSAVTPKLADAVAYYLERYRQRHDDEAFHGLRTLDASALPELAKVYHESTDTSARTFILNVIWQHRQPSEIPLLAEALFDSEPQIWKEAMEGLVAFASAESLQALRLARTRLFTNHGEGKRFSEWLEDAIEQAESKMSS
jgi:hypothetical protein